MDSNRRGKSYQSVIKMDIFKLGVFMYLLKFFYVRIDVIHFEEWLKMSVLTS